MDGILNIYKEKGFTSHDVVAKMRGILKQKKIGHTGTLDPDAVGVLPVCLGKGTKLCSLLTDWDKQYEAVLLLGVTTDTEDITGEVLAKQPCTCNEKEVLEAISSFLGFYEQIPPMYSAKKVNGKKLYELAREGKTIERKAARVEIIDIEVKEIALPTVRFTVTCSKGTYIRSLCRDIGEKLGCGGCMSSLKRIRTGGFAIDSAITLGQLEEIRDAGEIERYLVPVESVLDVYKKAQVYKKFEKLLYNGNPLLTSQFKIASEKNARNLEESKTKIVEEREGKEEKEKRDKVRMYDTKGNFIGLYAYVKEKQQWKPEKMFL